MKYLLSLIVASFVIAIGTAMLEDGPLTLPFWVGYLVGIVVPVVVFSGILTLVLAGIYRVFMGKDMQNLFAVMWGIWVVVAAVNFYGNLMSQEERRARQAHQAQEERGLPSATLTLQARFARDAQQLDEELARTVAAAKIPRLFDPAFPEDKSRFPAAAEQLEDYGHLFLEHKERRTDLLSQLKAEVEQLDLPKHEKLQVVQEFNNTYGIDGALSQEYFDVVIEVSRQGIAYLNFLDQARYRVSDGRVMFETDTDSDRYQAFLEIFKHLSEQEVAAQRELAESREQRMARLRELPR